MTDTWTEADGALAAAYLAEAIEALLDGIKLAEARLVSGQAPDDVEQAAFERGAATMTTLRPLVSKAIRITSKTGE